jgi:hypothetical protein
MSDALPSEGVHKVITVLPPAVVVEELPPHAASSPINITSKAPRAYNLGFTIFLLNSIQFVFACIYFAVTGLLP